MIIFLSIAGIFALALGFLLVREKFHRPLNFHKYFPEFIPMLSSHRGYGKYGPIAENTIPAFLASEKLGFRAHELDVRRSHDGKIVLLHGPKLENTTDGFGRVEDQDFSYIQKLDAAHYVGQRYKSPRTAHTPMPTLQEVLQKTSPKSRINVEIKRDRWDFSSGLEEETLHSISNSLFSNRIFFSGFHFLTLWRLRKLKSEIPIGLLIEPAWFAGLKLWLYRMILLPDNIHLHYSLASVKLMTRLKRKGYGLAFWTVNKEEIARFLFAHGADVVITDDMSLIKKFPAQRQGIKPRR